jgi:predicted kinase
MVGSADGYVALHFAEKPASGKTTLARELAARHAAVLFGEDEWLTRLDAEINSLADHVRHSKRLKAALAPLAVRLLQLGVPIVFDFAGNTPNDRAWVRSIFESASADHVLHYIVASDEVSSASRKPCSGRAGSSLSPWRSLCAMVQAV